jgi:hypothetical protein
VASPVSTSAAVDNLSGTIVRTADRAEAAAVPWYVWSMLTAVTSVMIGEYWDISWHMSIGRDTFWTPAHMAIYLAAVVAALSSGWLILSTTFGGGRKLKDSSVAVLGFRGPLAAFIAAWGGGAMLTSAPFDNWWHSAYGLDVKIQSPPHVLLAAGIFALNMSAVLMVASCLNRADGTLRRRLDWAVLYLGACLVVQAYVFGLESERAVLMHSSRYYDAMNGLPLVLLAVASVSESRWAITIMTGLYMALWLAGLWILPLFPAQPKLGPVYQHITHFVPLGFPALLIVPGIAMDLVRQRLSKTNVVMAAIALGSVFLAVLICVQWPFADFLISPWARNWVFGGHYFSYGDPANVYYNPYRFVAADKDTGEFMVRMLSAFISAALLSLVALMFGRWLRLARR